MVGFLCVGCHLPCCITYYFWYKCFIVIINIYIFSLITHAWLKQKSLRKHCLLLWTCRTFTFLLFHRWPVVSYLLCFLKMPVWLLFIYLVFRQDKACWDAAVLFTRYILLSHKVKYTFQAWNNDMANERQISAIIILAGDRTNHNSQDRYKEVTSFRCPKWTFLNQ